MLAPQRLLRKLLKGAGFVSALGYGAALRLGLAHLLRQPRVSIHARGLAHAIVLRPWSSDIRVAKQLLLDRELDIAVDPPVETVIDGGANIGLSTAILAQKFPAALIIAVEPDPGNLELLEENTRNLSNVVTVKGGLWPDDCALRIINPNGTSWAFRCAKTDPATPGAFRGHRIDSLLNSWSRDCCDLLKLDVEGAEEQIFMRSGGWIDRLRLVIVETHGLDARRATEAAFAGPDWRREASGEKHVFRRAPTALEPPAVA